MPTPVILYSHDFEEKQKYMYRNTILLFNVSLIPACGFCIFW